MKSLTMDDNAVLTILSTQKTRDGTDQSEMNTTAGYIHNKRRTAIRYSEADETGEDIGFTSITVFPDNLVIIRKSGFAQATMILELGKTHSVRYDTVLGSMEMRLCATLIEADFNRKGGTLRLEYMLDIGDTYAAVNTIDMRVKLMNAD